MAAEQERFQEALEAFQRGAEELAEAWADASIPCDAIEDYPGWMPSFDEAALEISGMRIKREPSLLPIIIAPEFGAAYRLAESPQIPELLQIPLSGPGRLDFDPGNASAVEWERLEQADISRLLHIRRRLLEASEEQR